MPLDVGIKCTLHTLVRKVRVRTGRTRYEDFVLEPPEPMGVVFKRLRKQFPTAAITPMEARGPVGRRRV